MHPDDAHARVSHETIYTALYALPRGTLRREVIAMLRQRRKRRRPRSRGEDRRGRIPNMTSIHVRPPEVDERVIPGHWQGDLIKGARNASAVGTLVERTTLFLSLAKVDNASAQAAVDGFSRVLNRERVNRRRYQTLAEARTDVFDYIERFHNPRIRKRTAAEDRKYPLTCSQPSAETA